MDEKRDQINIEGKDEIGRGISYALPPISTFRESLGPIQSDQYRTNILISNTKFGDGCLGEEETIIFLDMNSDSNKYTLFSVSGRVSLSEKLTKSLRDREAILRFQRSLYKIPGSFGFKTYTTKNTAILGGSAGISFDAPSFKGSVFTDAEVGTPPKLVEESSGFFRAVIKLGEDKSEEQIDDEWKEIADGYAARLKVSQAPTKVSLSCGFNRFADDSLFSETGGNNIYHVLNNFYKIYASLLNSVYRFNHQPLANTVIEVSPKRISQWDARLNQPISG